MQKILTCALIFLSSANLFGRNHAGMAVGAAIFAGGVTTGMVALALIETMPKDITCAAPFAKLVVEQQKIPCPAGIPSTERPESGCVLQKHFCENSLGERDGPKLKEIPAYQKAVTAGFYGFGFYALGAIIFGFSFCWGEM